MDLAVTSYLGHFKNSWLIDWFTELKGQLMMHWLPNICSTCDRHGRLGCLATMSMMCLLTACANEKGVEGWHRRLNTKPAVTSAEHVTNDPPAAWWSISGGNQYDCCRKALLPGCSAVCTASCTVTWRNPAMSTLTATGQSVTLLLSTCTCTCKHGWLFSSLTAWQCLHVRTLRNWYQHSSIPVPNCFWYQSVHKALAWSKNGNITAMFDKHQPFIIPEIEMIFALTSVGKITVLNHWKCRLFS